MTTGKNIAISRNEFEDHKQHVDQRIDLLDRALQSGFRGQAEAIENLSRKLDDRSRPNYGLLSSVVFGVLTIVLTLTSFAGALVYMSNSHVDELSKARDVSIEQKLFAFENGSNRFSTRDHERYADKQEIARKELKTEQIRQAERIAELSAELRALVAIQKRIESLISQTNDRQN